MKKIKILFLILFVFFTLKVQAQFEGTIKMKFQYEGDAASMMQSMSPSEMVFKMKGENSSIKMTGGMSSMLGKMITKDNKLYMVMDMTKTVYVSDQGADENEVEGEVDELNDAEVIDLKITETIAGYKCNKYEVVYSGEEEQQITKYYIWVAKDFKAKYSGQDKASNDLFNTKLGGFPFKQEMLMTTPMGDIKTITTVTEITKGNVPDSEFALPEGYALKPIAEMMNGMMNGMGGDD